MLSQAELYWIEETTFYLWIIAEVLLDHRVPRARKIRNENTVSAHEVRSLRSIGKSCAYKQDFVICKDSISQLL